MMLTLIEHWHDRARDVRDAFLASRAQRQSGWLTGEAGLDSHPEPVRCGLGPQARHRGAAQGPRACFDA
jgi:hypothetical protein